MPELPEVETVRRGLDNALAGAVIETIELRRKDLRTAFPRDFAKILKGRTIRKIDRRAKYLLFYLDSDNVMIAHLGMSGRFLINFKKPKKLSPHDHLVIKLKDDRYLIFNDTRRFGLLTYTNKKRMETHPLFQNLGPEPLSKGFTPTYLKKKLQARHSAVKPSLMDQHLVVGIGNIYASEALFAAGIHPKRIAADIVERADILHKAIQNVLEAAISSGGSSLRDFVNVGGESGYFQHAFAVYGREKKPCLKCRTPIKSIRQSGRSTFFCPKCQK